MAKISVTWKKSAIGYPHDQKRTIASLGLRRLNHTVEHEDTPPLRGMLNKVRHLVEVAEVATPAGKGQPTRRSSRRQKANDETS